LCYGSHNYFEMLGLCCMCCIMKKKSCVVVIYNFLYIVGFNVLIFCCQNLHLISRAILDCSFLVMSLSGFGMKVNNGLTKCIIKYSFCFYLWEKTVYNWYNFFCKCLKEFTSTPIVLSVWKIINCWFKFFKLLLSIVSNVSFVR
jgi:hypothetical protein